VIGGEESDGFATDFPGRSSYEDHSWVIPPSTGSSLPVVYVTDAPSVDWIMRSIVTPAVWIT
jgi:hypothetical protein